MPDTKPETIACHGGLSPFAHHGIVNPPVYHASTVLFPSVAALEAADAAPFDIINYGRIGTPTSQALERAVSELEGGANAVTTSSGLAALATALSAFTKAGDHVLITDSAYGPTRRFCDEVLGRYGVMIEYYDPLIAADISRLMRPETSVVFVESPGSLTFEVQDVPAIAAAAKAAGATVLMDNTWATPLYFRPFEHGVDVSIHAATKYIVGHADAMLGLIVCNADCYETVKRTAVRFGACAGPDDIYLALRGLRTLPVRLKRHGENADALCDWLSRQAEVARIIYPAWPEDPGHALWRRDFTGACGLFAVTLRPCAKSAVTSMLDALNLFGLGYSWGGFESLVLPCQPSRARTVTNWNDAGPLIRFHAGLENIDDLITDLDKGFRLLRAAC